MEPMEAELADHTVLLFRPIEPGDKRRLQEGLKRLSPEARYRRFFQHIDHFSAAQLRYLTELDMINHVGWIALLRDVPGQPGVGVARWARLPDDPSVAEGAVTVLDDYQGRGIGKALLVLAARSAVERGVESLRAWVQADNAPILHVLEELGARPGRIDAGLREVTIPLPTRPEDLPIAPGLLLRAAAVGAVEARARRDRPAGMHLDRPDR